MENNKFKLSSFKDARKRSRNTTSILKYEFDDEYLNIFKGKKYYLVTYGCQGNVVDGEKIDYILERLGFEKVIDAQSSDIIVLNTCAIRENATNRVYGELGRFKALKKLNPNLIIAVGGCMPQLEFETTKIREKYRQVDILFGTHNINFLAKYIVECINEKKKMYEVFSCEGDIVENNGINRSNKYFGYVNIMYGCDEFCSYCIVPYTRGKERSRLKDDILREVDELIKNGYKEICLLGQNVNAYGKDFESNNYLFSDLLSDLMLTKIRRVRFTTSHPKDLDDKTIQLIGKGNIMPHLHLPVQSGSNHILKKMNRKYTCEDYISKIEYLRKCCPNVSLTTDIIVGFPGESEEDFNYTMELVKKCDFEGAYTFIYSPRKGTPSALFENKIDIDIAHKRLLILNDLINQGFLKGNNRFINSIEEVLVVGKTTKNDSLYYGYTKNNKLVNFEGDDSLIGSIINIEITKAFTWHLRGKIV